MPEAVTRHATVQPGRDRRSVNGALENGLVQMMPPPLAGSWVLVGAGRRKDPLPRPLSPHVWKFYTEGIRYFDPPGTITNVRLMLSPRHAQLPP